MAYEKKPEFRYQNLGGINSKVSPYLNNQMEFLRLENFDFQTPGSLTSRWGSTEYFHGSSYFSGQVYGLFEYVKSTGESYFIVAGSTAGWMPAGSGLTPMLTSVSHASMIAFATYVNFATFGVSLAPAVSGFQGGNYDFAVMNDQLYACNGRDFWRFNGTSFFYFGLPLIGAPLSTSVSGAFTWAVGATGTGGFSGYFRVALAYVNDHGVVGNVSIAGQNASAPGLNAGTGNGVLTVNLTEQLVRSMNPGFGLSQIAIYISALGASPAPIYTSPLYYVGSVGLSSASGSGLTYVIDAGGYSNAMIGLTSAITQTIPYSRWYYADDFSKIVTGQSYQVVAGQTYLIQQPISPGSPANNTSLSLNMVYADTAHGNMTPRFMENHDSQLFMAGASYWLSTVFFSDFALPERIQADSNFEVRTDDGDIISGMKSYNGNLMIFKNQSFHSLNTAAEDPQQWTLTEISREYGCLSNRAIATYSNYLLFLDRKGIIRYNGANIEILSTKVDPIFQRMNVSAAMTQSQMTYDKQRNQVLCDIPVDGATMNNLTVVYDIIGNCFTTYSGYRPAITSIARGNFSTDQVFFGGYSGLVSVFGSSYTTDNNTGFTLIAKSGFTQDIGYATEKLYRRLYTDTVPRGTSALVDVNIYQDYGSSIVFGTTIAQTPFQTKVEMGVPARSISVEYVSGSTYAMTLHGFTIEYRFLRNI